MRVIRIGVEFRKVEVFVDLQYESPYSTPYTWGEIGSKALDEWQRVANKNKRSLSGYNSLKGCSVVGLYDPFNEILYNAHGIAHWQEWLLQGPTVYSQHRGSTSCVAHAHYKLIIQGPISNLSDATIREMFMKYITNSCQVNPLLRTCRRFRRIFSADVVWSQLKWSPNIWQGAGMGSHKLSYENNLMKPEELLWEDMACDAGLPITTQNRYHFPLMFLHCSH